MSQSVNPNVTPNIEEVLRQFVQLVSPEQRPLLIALAERMAAERYRAWAGTISDPAHQSGLIACGDREEEIARRIEALYPGAAAIQSDIVARNPNLADFSRSLFEPYSLNEQFALQAQGERLGAATWRSLAEKSEDPAAVEVLLSCALLEEESAVFLESLLKG
ncbi:MAG TPA: hypothetical protein VJX67_19920 [Blastocatellia bacterium]|nr:hypothetical protein [Blastocatellia bacterium]